MPVTCWSAASKTPRISGTMRLLENSSLQVPVPVASALDAANSLWRIRPGDFVHDPLGLVLALLLDQPARAFRNEENH